PEVYAPMRRLSAAYHDRQAAEAAAPSLASLSDAAEVASVRPPVPTRAPSIAFRNVTIAYEAGAPVLTGFDLEIAPGATVALLGASGSGKSSLLHLFLGLSPLSGGEVEIQDVRLSDHPDLTAWIAWAGQAPVVVPGTLGEN